MKIILLAFMAFPLTSVAQKKLPTMGNDTLYTTSGFKIYKGQTLYFGKGTGRNGNFRYVNIKSETATSSLTNNSIVVKKLKNFGISALGNAYIEIIGTLIFKDGSKGYIDIHMAFEKAIESFPGMPAELLVPDEFNKQKLSPADEINKLYKLYQDSIITKEEFELQKKKILNQ